MFDWHLYDRRLGVLLRVVLQLRLEFGNPTLRLLFVNLPGVELACDFVKKSLKESFHPPDSFADSMPTK
jgi:hypothetical protein